MPGQKGTLEKSDFKSSSSSMKYSLINGFYGLKEFLTRPDHVLSQLPFCGKYFSMSRVKRYINKRFSIDTFFRELSQREIRYVVLRWFEDLPFVEKGEDIDLLIHDDDLEKVKDLFSTIRKNPRIVDIYSVTAICSYGGAPYYPPSVAEDILRERVLWKNLCYVPNPEHYFLSLAYHAVYHKHEKSGLSTSKNRSLYQAPDHPYAEILTAMAKKLDLNVTISLDDLHIYLVNNGWSPTPRMLKELAVAFPESLWLKSVLESQNMDYLSEGEVSCFFIDEWLTRNNKLPFILKLFQEKGLNIIAIMDLGQQERTKALTLIKNQNWRLNHFPFNPGVLSKIIITEDEKRKVNTESFMSQSLHLIAKNVLLEEQINKSLRQEIIRTNWRHFVYGSDNPSQAWQFIKFLYPDKSDEIKAMVQTFRCKQK